MQVRERRDWPKGNIGNGAWRVLREECSHALSSRRRRDVAQRKDMVSGRIEIWVAERRISEAVLCRWRASADVLYGSGGSSATHSTVKVLCSHRCTFDRSCRAEVHLDRTCASLLAPSQVDVRKARRLVWALLKVLLEGEEDLLEVCCGGIERAVTVRDGDGKDEEVGRRERE